VSLPCCSYDLNSMLTSSDHIQNKRGKYDRHDGRDDKEKVPEEPAEDALKDATTLYVGNLYGYP
jgi:hypothetical protein